MCLPTCTRCSALRSLAALAFRGAVGIMPPWDGNDRSGPSAGAESAPRGVWSRIANGSPGCCRAERRSGRCSSTRSPSSTAASVRCAARNARAATPSMMTEPSRRGSAASRSPADCATSRGRSGFESGQRCRVSSAMRAQVEKAARKACVSVLLCRAATAASSRARSASSSRWSASAAIAGLATSTRACATNAMR